MLVNCYVCGRSFEASAEKVQQWADSGRAFDPTDWMCDYCANVGLDAEDYMALALVDLYEDPAPTAEQKAEMAELEFMLSDSMVAWAKEQAAYGVDPCEFTLEDMTPSECMSCDAYRNGWADCAECPLNHA